MKRLKVVCGTLTIKLRYGPAFAPSTLRKYIWGLGRPIQSMYPASSLTNENYNLFFREHSASILHFGVTETHTTLQVARQVLTLKKQSYQPTGVQVLPRSVSEWGSEIRLGLFFKIRLPPLFTPSSPTERSVQPAWVVIPGRRWLVLRAPYSATAIEKGLMLFAAEKVILPKQESVSLETTKTTAAAASPESDSAWKGRQMVP